MIHKWNPGEDFEGYLNLSNLVAMLTPKSKFWCCGERKRETELA